MNRMAKRLSGVFALLIALLGWPMHLSAAQPATTLAPERPRVALVLSGGGARGFSHVGVLKALEAARVPVDMVVGTSMGAIIGGLYASGMTPDELEREILEVDWGNLFTGNIPRQALSQRRKEQDFTFSPVLQLGFRNGQFTLPAGTVSSRSLELLLRRYTLHTRHLTDFDQLPIPFRAIATDMVSGEAVLLQQGDLAAALRASMSVPGLFSPLDWEGRLLGDGGLVNNLPVDVARQMGADLVIAVNIGTPLASRDSLGSVVGVTLQMINILTEQNVARNVALLTPNDLLLQPQLGTLSSASFDQAPALVQLGLAYGESVRTALDAFAIEPLAYDAWQAQRRERYAQLMNGLPETLAFVRIEGTNDRQTRRLARQLDVQPGDAPDALEIERDLERLIALDDYVRLDYRLEPEPGSAREGLVYQLTDDPASLNQFRIGLDLKTDFQGLGDFSLRISHNRRDLNHLGAQWRNRVELGATVAAGTELYHPFGSDQQLFLSTYADHELRRIEWFDEAGDPLAQLRRRTTRLGIDAGWHLGRTGNTGDLRLGLVLSRRQSLPQLANRLGANPVRDIAWSEAAWRFAWVADQLDHANFPESGHRYSVDLQSGRYRVEGSNTGFLRWTATANEVFRSGPHIWNAYLSLARSSTVSPSAVDEYALGGFQNLSGYRPGQLAGNEVALARLGYYRRMEPSPGLARAWYVGGTLEAGVVWKQASSRTLQRSIDRWRLGSSLYVGADTRLGPVYLSLVHAPKGYTGLYFLLGRP